MSERAACEAIMSELARGAYPADAVNKALAAPGRAGDLAAALLRESSPGAREVGLDLIRCLGPAAGRQEPLVLGALEDGSEQVRAAAAWAAAYVCTGSAELDRALLRALQLSRSKPWPVLLAIGLRAKDEKLARAQLAKWLPLSEDVQDRLYACQALLRLGESAETTAAAIQCALRSDRVDDVGFALDLCLEFGEALGRHCAEVRRLRGSPDAITVERAEEALTRMGCTRS